MAKITTADIMAGSMVVAGVGATGALGYSTFKAIEAGKTDEAIVFGLGTVSAAGALAFACANAINTAKAKKVVASVEDAVTAAIGN